MLWLANSTGSIVTAALVTVFVLQACRSSGQTMPNQSPEDLLVEAVAGGTAPWSVNRSIRIQADGTGLYTTFRPGDVGAPPRDRREFRVEAADIDTLWSVIQESDFFSLNPEYRDEGVKGGSVATLTITAHGRTHRVRIQNVAQTALISIIEALNAITPDDLNLVYAAPSQ